MNNEDESIKLQLFMSRAGVASRRKCEDYILQKRVSVNGIVSSKPGIRVRENDVVCFDGNRIKIKRKNIYIALNKPPGYICSAYDPEGRPLAINFIYSYINERLFSVGRLDYMSSGLIFFTNDGNFARNLTHASYGIEKEYLVNTKQPVPENLLTSFMKGKKIDGVHYQAVLAELYGTRRARIILHEGKNREIRKIFQSESLKIKSIHRTRIGSVHIGSLKPGHFRKITTREVQLLMNHPSRGRI